MLDKEKHKKTLEKGLCSSTEKKNPEMKKKNETKKTD